MIYTFCYMCFPLSCEITHSLKQFVLRKSAQVKIKVAQQYFLLQLTVVKELKFVIVLVGPVGIFTGTVLTTLSFSLEKFH